MRLLRCGLVGATDAPAGAPLECELELLPPVVVALFCCRYRLEGIAERIRIGMWKDKVHNVHKRRKNRYCRMIGWVVKNTACNA